jgi:phospholipid/cholesterol/gamma-HCH transport system substrate-binding protein
MNRVARFGFGMAAVIALVAGGCSLIGGGGDDLTVTGTFDDVADMADGAPVHMADVRIGSVTGIDLDESGTRATLELTIDEDAGVPAAVTARVRRTSPLGEKFVELRPDSTEDGQEMLADGAVVEETEVVPDFEQLVASGTELFAALGASELAVMLDEGAEGFGGQGPRIRSVLSDFRDIAAGFNRHSGEITTLIESVDQLASDTGPAAVANAEALERLATTTRILDEQSDRLLDLLEALRRLSNVGSDMLDEHYARLGRQIEALRAVTDAAASQREALETILEYGPGHNRSLDLGTTRDFSHVLNDFIICGLPGGGDQPGDEVNSCSGE